MTTTKQGSSSFSFRFPSWDVSAFTLPLFPELGEDFHTAGHQLPPTRTTNRPFMIFPETNDIGITKTSTPIRILYSTTFKPMEKDEKGTNIKPFVSFGKKPKRPSSTPPTQISSVNEETTVKTPSKLWSALPPHLPKRTTSPPVPKESTTPAGTMSQKLPKVKRVKMAKKKVKPFVFLGGSKQQPQTDILKVKPSTSQKVKPTKSTIVSFEEVVTTKATKPSIIYFKKVTTTQAPKPPVFKKVKTTRAPMKIFNVNNNVMNLTTSKISSYKRPTNSQPVRYKVKTTSTTKRKELTTKRTTRKTTPKPKTTRTTSVKKELTTLKPNQVSTTRRNQGNILVTEPFFPNTSSDQKKPDEDTEDKSEKLKVTTEKSEDSSDENEKKSFSLMVSALGVPDIWDMLLFGRYTKVQSQNIHHSGIVSMQPLQ